MSFDIYRHVRALSDDLKAEGEVQWSSALDAAMSISAMSGEILGEVRVELRKLSHTDVAQRLGLQQRIDVALHYLDCVLGP